MKNQSQLLGFPSLLSRTWTFTMLHSLCNTERFYSALAGRLFSSVPPSSCEGVTFPVLALLSSADPAATCQKSFGGFIWNIFIFNKICQNKKKNPNIILTSHFPAIGRCSDIAWCQKLLFNVGDGDSGWALGNDRKLGMIQFVAVFCCLTDRASSESSEI